MKSFQDLRETGPWARLFGSQDKTRQAPAVLSNWSDADLTNFTIFNLYHKPGENVSLSLLVLFFLVCVLGVWEMEVTQGVGRKLICQSKKPKTLSSMCSKFKWLLRLLEQITVPEVFLHIIFKYVSPFQLYNTLFILL